MSLIDFTKRIFSSETCQDIVFDFGTTDDDPLLAHGNILGFYSPVFSKIIHGANIIKDAANRIQIQVTDSNKKTYEVFVRGIYNGFTETHASKDLFQLVQKYRLPQDLVENIFSASNVWHCLEFALASPEGSAGSFLLQKCERMLKFNKSVYKDLKALKSIDASTIIHALKQKKIPLKKKEVKEFIELWKEVNKDKENLQENLAQLYEAVVMILQEDEPWQTPILNVSSQDLEPFSIEYKPNAKVQKLAEDASFVTQVEKERICFHQRQLEPEMDLNSEKNLKELGLKEDDEIIVKLKKEITLREMSGHKFQVHFKDDDTVDDLKKKVVEKLEAAKNDVNAFRLTLVKDRNRLENGKTLLESGVKESSLISIVIGDRKIKRILDVNVAAEAGTEITASSIHSAGYEARKALPGGACQDRWVSNGTRPGWWCAEFARPKTIGRLQFTQQYSDIFMSFLVEVGSDDDNWTTVFTEDHTSLPGQQCTFDLDNEHPHKFCRIYIESMRQNSQAFSAHLHQVIMNEVIWE